MVSRSSRRLNETARMLRTLSDLMAVKLLRLRLAAFLLLALLTHLLLMATPLHGRVMQEDVDGQRGARLHHEFASSALANTEGSHLAANHCSMEWTSPRTTEFNLISSPVVIGTDLLHQVSVAASRPLAQVLGPPWPRTDRQALLQVFRL